MAIFPMIGTMPDYRHTRHNWYTEMVENDVDDCTKNLICEINFRKEQGESLGSVEKEILEILESSADVFNDIFQLVTKAGRLCDYYRRCDTPVIDIITNLQGNLEKFRQLEKEERMEFSTIIANLKENLEKFKQQDDEELMIIITNIFSSL